MRRWPIITPDDRTAVLRVLDRGVLSGAGAPEMKALETEFAATLGGGLCLATNSGTSALHIALGALGLKPGDEVIVPALSFIATAQAVLHEGAVPVFADVDPVTYNIVPAEIERRLTPRTRAIMPVHLHGLPADMDEINAIADAAGVVTIEDAAQAHGAMYRGRPVGTLAAMAALSLNATKNFPAGEGGLFVTTSDRFWARAARVRFDGLEPPSKWDAERPLDDEADSLATVRGWMYLPGEMTCAFARSQLTRLHETTERARRNGARLTARLGALPGVIAPAIPDDRTHVFHKYRVQVDPDAAGLRLSRRAIVDRLLDALRAEGVEAVLWQQVPLPAHPLFGSREDYPGATRALEASLIIGSQSYPLFAQPLDVVDAWGDAFERVWRSLRS